MVVKFFSKPFSKTNGSIKKKQVWQWFYDLPIRRKQLLGLFTSEFISVVGLVGVGTYLIISGGRQQLVQQVKSEISVTAIQYGIKINQMGFGFRGQSDNAAIIEAARTHQQGQALNPELQEQVRNILSNEITARSIEYATLVGSDLKIIANANANRFGEFFNPNQLVTNVLATPKQIKTSEVVKWEEIAQEQPPIAAQLSPQDILIRYTATPVIDPETNQTIGVLISGDTVNGKVPIVEETIKTLNGGYSAVYLQPETNEFIPVSVFEADGHQENWASKQELKPVANSDSDTPRSRSSQPTTMISEAIAPTLVGGDILTQAVQHPNQVVTGRDRVGNTTYTLAAKAIVNYRGEAVGVLVRGTSEAALNALLKENLSTQLVITFIALVADLGLAIVLGFALIEPTRRLQQTAKKFAHGDFRARAEVLATDEVGQLTQTFNDMAESLVNTFKLEEQVEAEKRLNDQLQQEIVERQRAEVALQDSDAKLRAKNQILEQTLRELQETQAKVIHSEKMSSLGQLVAGVAHEINNPVNFIHGNLPHVEDYTEDLLALIQIYQRNHSAPDETVQDEIEAIDLPFIQRDLPKTVASMRMGTERIRKIVRSLRNFSRMDEAEYKAVDLHEGIDSTLLILQHRLNSQPARPAIKIIKDYGDLPLVECYIGQLNQVLMNILVNAIDALEETIIRTPDSPENHTVASVFSPAITLKTQTITSDWIEIAIADNGPGIPEEIRTHIFDPFFTTKPVGKGTGMGLSISYAIITETHKGRLECHSKPGQGTEFIIQIPYQQTDRASDSNTASALF